MSMHRQSPPGLVAPNRRRLSGAATLAAAWALLGMVALAGCTPSSEARSAEGAPAYAATTSWLECCVRDLLGPDTAVLRIAPPGTCPGHFDVSPGIVAGLRKSRVLFLFDFQKSLGARLDSLGREKPELALIPAPEGLCVPSSYRAGCRSVAEALAASDGELSSTLTAALARIEDRLDMLENEMRRRVAEAGLTGTRVVCSGHQAEFCRWLGLDPVASYSGENATPGRLEKLIAEGRAAQVPFVIANLQEGRQMGEALTHPLKARLVVFSNFPAMTPGHDTFDDLVLSNLEALLDAAGEVR